ncbi:hypothetical protein E4416_17315 [Stenotrophomonas maltophilia]|uniref:hypothetical protein n=1 Tax=Stenotrophomonas maltophilia TaxID=40324 RepID=UPI0011101BCC|nr:hypothetical protein [Stenotrophomonas maltophilia]TIK68818.1 hypothetical protein E4416_17315 [Stenotrophomonas maltophilia]TIK71259.1 hypothetical protein E4418_05180 [Stenotrophomonas maltophilia]
MFSCLFAAGIQWIHLRNDAPRLFGFPEFLSGLALLLLVWTIFDVRYRFRVATARIHVEKFAMIAMISVGCLTLLTDWWRATSRPVIAGSLLTPETWQAALAAVFFATLIAWTIAAFSSSNRFSAANASRFSEAVQKIIDRGRPDEISVLVEELGPSMGEIARELHAPETEPRDEKSAHACAERIAHRFKDRKFCRTIVVECPTAIPAFFREIPSTDRPHPTVIRFAENLVAEAIRLDGSFLYNEDYFPADDIDDEAHPHPASTALVCNRALLDYSSDLLAPREGSAVKLSIPQWHAYLGLVSLAHAAWMKDPSPDPPHALHWARFFIDRQTADLAQIRELVTFQSEPYQRVEMELQFIGRLIAQIPETPPPGRSEPAIRYIEAMAFSLIESAAEMRAPQASATKIQSSLIWKHLFSHSIRASAAGRQFQERIAARMLASIRECPSLDAVRLLSFCINALGLSATTAESRYGEPWRAFHTELLAWMKINLDPLLERYPRMSEGFVEGIEYDAPNHTLIRWYVERGQRQPHPETLLLTHRESIRQPPDSDQKPRGTSNSLARILRTAESVAQRILGLARRTNNP